MMESPWQVAINLLQNHGQPGILDADSRTCVHTAIDVRPDG
jgi:hypothetical protein